jgi:hypothetical protein
MRVLCEAISIKSYVLKLELLELVVSTVASHGPRGQSVGARIVMPRCLAVGSRYAANRSSARQNQFCSDSREEGIWEQPFIKRRHEQMPRHIENTDTRVTQHEMELYDEQDLLHRAI